MVVMEGCVRYSNEEDFKNALSKIEKIVDDKGFIISSDGSIDSDDPHIDADMLCISIPYSIYEDVKPEDLYSERANGRLYAIDIKSKSIYYYQGAEYWSGCLLEFASENYPDDLLPEVEGTEQYEEWVERMIDRFLDSV
jgi:hypothetical protein